MHIHTFIHSGSSSAHSPASIDAELLETSDDMCANVPEYLVYVCHGVA